MNKNQCVHLWAQQTKPSGKSGNVFFEGPTIFSYGSHFPIATFVKPGVVLFTSRSYSSSTSGHKSAVRGAISHHKIYTVADVYAHTKAEHAKNYRALVVDYETAVAELARKRDKESQILRIQGLCGSANAYSKEFKLGRRLVMPKNLLEAAKEADAVIRQREAKKRAAEDKKNVALIEDWLRGKVGYCPSRKVLFRVVNRDDGPVVQTSKGAEFPTSHCQRVWNFIQRVKTRGTDWHKNGEACPVGLFQIDEIDATGNVKAGCHDVHFAEIEQLANTLSLS